MYIPICVYIYICIYEPLVKRYFSNTGFLRKWRVRRAPYEVPQLADRADAVHNDNDSCNNDNANNDNDSNHNVLILMLILILLIILWGFDYNLTKYNFRETPC